MDRHFECTACGKCCYGWLPLSLDDALLNADKFPLFLLWTPVRPGGKSYDLMTQLGFVLKLRGRKKAAVWVTPVSYVPTGMACPALDEKGLCSIHENKPQRCRTMPFSGNRDESDQADLLLPKPTWECDISEAAPVVYRNKTIVARADFDAEREQLIADAKILKPYGELMLDSVPRLRGDLERMASRPQGGYLIVNFSSLVSRLPNLDIYDFAMKQQVVLETFANLTKGCPDVVDEHKRYVACGQEWAELSSSVS